MSERRASAKPGEAPGLSLPFLPPAMRRLRFELKMLLGRYPRIYLPLIRRRARGEPVRSDTAIVIEGYPRSGNTFATAAFGIALDELPHPHPVVAHHLHVPGQIIAAVRRRIPALVLIRPPEEAVLSLVVQQPHLSIRQALRAYVRFYAPLVAYLNDFVLASFEEVVDDFGAVIARVNNRFGTSFPIFEDTEENRRLALRLIEEENRGRWGHGRQVQLKGAFPSDERTRVKDVLREAYRRPRLRSLRTWAERLYNLIRS